MRMSELNERLWAVLSERGREAAGLTYEEAAVLVRELHAGGAQGRKVSGLCIITDRAAGHVTPAKKEPAKKKGNGASPADGTRRRTRRASKKGGA